MVSSWHLKERNVVAMLGSGAISIPESFTTGLTNLVTNFGTTIANWLPTIILVALGITAVFALFRVVRGYAKGAFRG